MQYLTSYVFVALTVLFTVSGQIAIKWAVLQSGETPSNIYHKLTFIGRMLLNGWVIFGLLAAFVASLTWILAMTKLPLSHAYPFVAISFVLVLVLSNIFFSEPITNLKIIGVVLIIAGIVVASQG